MSLEITKISSASQLPEEWDSMATGYFQTTSFLGYTEKYNSCNQRYYVLKDGGSCKSGIIIYSLDLDLFTFLPFARSMKMNISGIPCSVSNGGFVGDKRFLEELLLHVTKIEKGLTLCLNLDRNLKIKGFASGVTLPSIVFRNRYNSWENYLSCLRSPYRRRIKLFSDRFKVIVKKNLSCRDFSEEMYSQYRDVHKRSKGKLETLSNDFFVNLPEDFYLSAFYLESRLLGWHIVLHAENNRSFFMGGIDYQFNKEYRVYFNMLIDILKEGIDAGVQEIDFGQTAETPKLRLGGDVVEKYMIGSHSGSVFRKLLNIGSSFLEYKGRFVTNNVLK